MHTHARTRHTHISYICTYIHKMRMCLRLSVFNLWCYKSDGSNLFYGFYSFLGMSMRDYVYPRPFSFISLLIPTISSTRVTFTIILQNRVLNKACADALIQKTLSQNVCDGLASIYLSLFICDKFLSILLFTKYSMIVPLHKVVHFFLQPKNICILKGVKSGNESRQWRYKA